MSGVGKVVCVTGGSGFIASWLIKLLLQRGYTVKASVRDPADPKKTEHLLALDGANVRLHLFKANLLEEGSFDGAIDGCDGVFHTASPTSYACKNPQSELLDPAVKGTLNVLNSCSKASSVKRVIITASFASVIHNGKPRTPDVTVDEKWVSSAEFCNESKAWYPLSKTLAEEAAWKFAMDHAIDVIVMNPSNVIGPLLQPTLNASCERILDLINGASTYPNLSLGWVNVRDVAKAHILAYESSSANGRYLLTERIAHYSEIVEVIQALFPDIQVTQQCVDSKFALTYRASTEKAKSLGVSFIPLEMSIRETIESLKEKGFFIKFGQ